VHFPIAFIFATQLLDLVYTASTHPTTAKYISSYVPYNVTPHLGDIARLGNLANLLAFALGIPAILTGALDLLELLSRQAVQDKIAKADATEKVKAATTGLHPKIKAAFMHAIWMDITIAATGYGWWIRRDNALGAPGIVNAYIAGGTILSFTLANWAAKQLVYKYGVGVYSAGVLQKKDQ
jgi:uncharacterized membrane protein